MEAAASIPPGISEAELAEHERRKAAHRRALGCALPGPLAAAFSPPPLTVLGRTVRPLAMGDFIILHRLGSPLAVGETKWTLQQIADLLFTVTTPFHSAMELSAAGREHWDQATLSILGPELLEADSNEILAALLKHYDGSFATVLDYEPEREPGTVTIDSFPDGLGWWLQLFAMLQKDYGRNRNDALETTLAEAWALWSAVRDSSGFLRRTGLGYVGQMAKALAEETKQGE